MEGEEGDVNEGDNWGENLENAVNGNLMVEMHEPTSVDYYSQCLVYFNPKLVNKLLPADRHLLDEKWEPKKTH